MKTLLKIMLSPLERARAFRDDESGQVLLLSGMMMFLVVIMGLMALDSSKAIYHRILSQNAVDAAADASALWQARGLNLLQHLNNLHYDVNRFVYIAETAALVACALGPPSAAIPIVGTAIAYALCGVCAVAFSVVGTLDDFQYLFNKLVMGAQALIVYIFPIFVFLYAQVCAKASGADPFLNAIVDYIDSMGDKIGFDLPDSLGDSDFMDTVGDIMPVYAMPMDPTALSLHCKKQDLDKTKNKFPWHYQLKNSVVVPAVAGCNAFIPNAKKCALIPDNDCGWHDTYYYGYPGFMTWLAGKTEYEEAAGLGKLVWMHGKYGTDAEINARLVKDKNVDDAEYYTGEPTGSKELEIPAFMAIASSQVEGDPVVSKGDANAVGKLITVFIPKAPGNDKDPIKGETLFIYH